MSLRFTPQALADAKRIKTWWRQNRPGAPDAFDQELEAVLERSSGMASRATLHPGALKRADIVLVTDGGSDPSSAATVRGEAAALGATILGLGIGVEREWLVPWCDEVHAVADLSTVDDTSAAALFAA